MPFVCVSITFSDACSSLETYGEKHTSGEEEKRDKERLS